MKEIIERLIAEETALNENMFKLEKFIASDKLKTIDKGQQYLLKIQHKAMATYSECLNQRLILIGEEEALNK